MGWRLLNGKPKLRVAVWLQGCKPVCAGLAYSLFQSAAAAAVRGLWRCLHV